MVFEPLISGAATNLPQPCTMDLYINDLATDEVALVLIGPSSSSYVFLLVKLPIYLSWLSFYFVYFLWYPLSGIHDTVYFTEVIWLFKY